MREERQSSFGLFKRTSNGATAEKQSGRDFSGLKLDRSQSLSFFFFFYILNA